jgi:hypothetical protein
MMGMVTELQACHVADTCTCHIGVAQCVEMSIMACGTQQIGFSVLVGCCELRGHAVHEA